MTLLKDHSPLILSNHAKRRLHEIGYHPAELSQVAEAPSESNNPSRVSIANKLWGIPVHESQSSN